LSHRLRTFLPARAFIARNISAAVLLLTVNASALSPGVLAATLNCPMPCCHGISELTSCPGGVCHTHFAIQPTKPVRQSDPICGSGDISVVRGGALRAQYVPAVHVHSRAHTAHKIEHTAARPVSQRNTTRRAARSGVSVSPPCASDCGAVLSSLTQLRRTHDDATLPRSADPRGPALIRSRRTPKCIVEASAALRRACPPRAPPRTFNC
jgi:hypothetical protein